jgi:hypothetical protein
MKVCSKEPVSIGAAFRRKYLAQRRDRSRNVPRDREVVGSEVGGWR